MRAIALGTAAICLLGLAGCESGSGSGPAISGPPPTYQDISGSYSGPVAATNTGLALTGTMYLFLTQEDGVLGGSYAVVGDLDESGVVDRVTLLGSVENGSLTTGSNPTLQFDLRPVGCAAAALTNTGAYSDADGTITLDPANIPVQDLACVDLARSVSGTVVLAP